MTTGAKTVSEELEKVVSAAISDPGMVHMWGAAVAVAYLPEGHAAHGRAAHGLAAPKSPAVGVLRVEARTRHSDALSVAGGMLLKATDSHAVRGKSLWVLGGADGGPDIAHLCRDGGNLAKFVG